LDITYKDTKAINPRSIQALFRRLEWWDWWTLGDIGWYFNHALCVVSAWNDRKLVGLGVLTGDGRIDVHLSALVVDAICQRRGIATAILGRLVDRVAELKPYSFQTDVIDERAERLYGRFGFRRNESTWLLHHEATYMRWGPKAVAARKARRVKRQRKQIPATATHGRHTRSRQR
jgi:ribosomal protein S18 acetylase RimI-like enzyme